jgi:hypothetical protein
VASISDNRLPGGFLAITISAMLSVKPTGHLPAGARDHGFWNRPEERLLRGAAEQLGATLVAAPMDGPFQEA